jgi:hypothetical protein
LQAAKQPNGGADGSMLTDPTEVLRGENNGLQNIVGLLTPIPAQFNVSAGDVLHVSVPIHSHLRIYLPSTHPSSLAFSVSYVIDCRNYALSI